MAKDPAFLFYPGDYLRDTQNLSPASQVAYDRIMCEHMRNICITQQQLNFFTKRLSEDEKSELNFVLIKVSGGFQIEWVAESINKRKDYSDSRRKNRTGKKDKKEENISKSYVEHMENEDENETEIKDANEILKNPTKGECELFFQQCGKTTKEGELFFHHYQAQNWKIGNGQKITDWASLAQKWILNPTKTNENGKRDHRREPNEASKDFGKL